MIQKRGPLLIALLMLTLTVYWLKQKEQKVAQKHFVTNVATVPVLQTQSHARTSQNDSPPAKPMSLNIKNIRQMTQILKTSVDSSSLQSTLDLLQKMQMQPSLMQETNRDTGTLSIVRTEKPPKGTRYFHAQYFSSDTRKPYLQHMSFEIPPGKDSLRTAAQSIKDIFGSLPPADVQTPDMIAWTWKGKYTVWAMKLNKDALVSDAFNAYSAQDEGTVRIAVELDIHSEGHNH